jgi:hypothetical protein
LLRRLDGRRFGRNDDLDPESNQLCGQIGEDLQLAFSRSKFNQDILPVDIAKIA